MKQFLHGAWMLSLAEETSVEIPVAVRERAELPATVPGGVHTDLLNAGLIPDPTLGRHESDVQWIAYVDWEYRHEVVISETLLAHEHVELVCRGLDTVARITVNGTVVAETADMHTAYRFDIKPHLAAGANRIAIRFFSAPDYAHALEAQLGPRPYIERKIPPDESVPVPYPFIRKTACAFGWDWGPVLPPIGIWQPIYLDGWDTARLAAVRPLVMEATPEQAVVRVLAEIDSSAGGDLRLETRLTAPTGETVTASAPATESGGDMTLEVADPALWWPLGYGEHPLYGVTVRLLDAAGTELDAWTGRIGLRSVRLNTEPDATGSRFVLEINGQEVFCKGANWIPDDVFPTRISDDRYHQRIQQAADAHMNMLRVWGGGIYENEAFYRICDEMGMMVWQDFPFACATYPEEEPIAGLVEAEARYQVTRLSPHASLVLWNGNNENFWQVIDFGWQDQLDGKSWGAGYYLDLLPRIMRELDPSRPYWPGSPFSGSLEIHPNANEHGNRHIWDVWFYEDYPVYRSHQPRFCSEFGFQGPATYATLERALPAEDLRAGSPGMVYHQRSNWGDASNERFMKAHFNPPGDFDSWHYLLQLNQARALTTGVEWFRSLQPLCMGTLYWQLNDCWPAISWAAVDSDGRPKPLWYATRRFFAPRLLTIQPSADSLAVFANNDTGLPWTGDLVISRVNFAGETLVTDRVTLAVPPRTNDTMATLTGALALPGDATAEMLVAQVGDVRALWFFERDKHLNYPAPRYDADLRAAGRSGQQYSYRLTLTARTLLRDAAIFVDRLDPHAAISDQLVTLLPGESHTFTLQSSKPLDVAALTERPVFQCANWYGREG